MIGAFDDEHRLVTSALEACSVTVEATARGRWNVTLLAGAALPTRVSLEDGWLLLDSGPLELPSQAAPPYWPLLALNRALPPLAKYCSRDGSTWHVAAQAPLADDLSVTHVVRDTATAVAHGLAWLCDLPLPTPAAGASDAPAILETLCNDSGWSFRMRDSATALVALEAGSEFQQAAVTIEPSLGIVAAVPLLPGVETAALSPLCRDALGVFLLRVCSALRMVRVAADTQEPPARLEVALGHTATPETLAHALAALSLAFRISNREAMVLSSDEPIARRFLSQRTTSVASLAYDQREATRAA